MAQCRRICVQECFESLMALAHARALAQLSLAEAVPLAAPSLSRSSSCLWTCYANSRDANSKVHMAASNLLVHNGNSLLASERHACFDPILRCAVAGIRPVVLPTFSPRPDQSNHPSGFLVLAARSAASFLSSSSWASSLSDCRCAVRTLLCTHERFRRVDLAKSDSLMLQVHMCGTLHPCERRLSASILAPSPPRD
eukprot:6201211-Pleurochrysis_carterae.AAC.3